MLCNLQPRKGTILEELTIKWNGLAISRATELTLLIKNYVDIFVLTPYEVERMKVVHHSTYTA